VLLASYGPWRSLLGDRYWCQQCCMNLPTSPCCLMVCLHTQTTRYYKLHYTGYNKPLTRTSWDVTTSWNTDRTHGRTERQTEQMVGTRTATKNWLLRTVLERRLQGSGRPMTIFIDWLLKNDKGILIIMSSRIGRDRISWCQWKWKPAQWEEYCRRWRRKNKRKFYYHLSLIRLFIFNLF